MKIFLKSANCDGCGYKKLEDENGNILLSGDWYHDHINQLIDGYLRALTHFDIKFELYCEDISCPYDCNDD